MRAAAVALVALISGSAAEIMHDVMTAAQVPTLNDDMLNKALEVFPGASNCFTTGQLPEAPRSLSFCHKFNDGACCVPQLDDENNEFFGMLTNLGLSCRIRGDIRVDPLATFYCLNCDPEQPKYIRLGMKSLDGNGEPYSEASANGLGGGDYNVSNPNFVTGAVQDLDAEDKGTLLVDVDWAANEFKTSPLLAGPDKRLAKCGLLVSVPCQDENGAELAGRDRYTCGDDLVIPSNPDHGAIVWNASAGDCGGNCVPLVNASLEKFLNVPSLGTPLIDEAYYFKLVRNSACSDEEAISHLNPHCLRTATQMTTLLISELKRVDSTKDMTYQDWVCSKGMTAAAPANVTRYCTTVDCKTGADAAADAAGNTAGSTTEIAKMKLLNPCCCGTWHDEKAFSSAFTFQPIFAITLAILAMCFSL